jgi:TonB family protein
MRFLLVMLFSLLPLSTWALNDFFIGSEYSVVLSFNAAGPGINAPEPKKMPAPIYPVELLNVGFTGEVVFDFTVEADGRVAEVVVISSTADEFKKASVAAAKRWRFFPAFVLKGEKPVTIPTRMRCRTQFVIEEKKEPNQPPEPMPLKRHGSS